MTFVPYLDDSSYRSLPDPEFRNYFWRCYDFKRQFQFEFPNGRRNSWYPLTRWREEGMFSGTPARQAVWLDLFLYPYMDSPRD